ncbi:MULTISPECIES: hypothetical protein [unclassified Synechococcus]|jgi:hypothetical protein|uniref:hypothetical protein n=1 Tax=unclassified Synechococcus TaxID=2626047 RepID=UPI0013760B8E|nr:MULTISPECIES: hypothetical protein [unclassified Synechococcus]QNG28158.1 hypothetical protein H0O21_06440 [Synechococcus sp. HK01-R]
MPLETQQLDDGAIRVCLRQDGIEACTVVSSFHLVEDKRRQLELSIQRKAAAAFS